LATVYVRFPAPWREPAMPAPLLERLLARADARALIGDWRSDAFALIARAPDPSPAVAPAALLAALGPQDGRFAFIATPVHCVAAMTSVHLDADGVQSLDAAQAAELAHDFNRVLGGAAYRLLASSTGGLYFISDRPFDVATADPQDVLGRDIGGFLPAGVDGPKLRALMSEIEMWLFEHPVNRAREGAGRAALTGLWLWGGGGLLSTLPPLSGWVAGDDALFNAWPAHQADGRGAMREGSGVIVLAAEPGTLAWAEAESRWIVPALGALNAGRIDRLDLSAGRYCFHIGRRARWRVWRRTRPWWEHFA
jgi:hypothetical protein